MNDALFSLCANIFGFVSGGISLLGFIAAICRPHLPSKKIQTLEDLLFRTENTFTQAVEDGLLVLEFKQKTEERLAVLKEQTCSYRARVDSATTVSQDYTEFLRGTSTAIGRICQSVKKLRAEVITSSQERRHRLMQMDSQQTQLPSALPSISVTQHYPTPTPPDIIRRPNSCPPALPVQQFDRSSSPSDPLTDSRSDSDVRTVGVQH